MITKIKFAVGWEIKVEFCTQAVFKGEDCISLKQHLLDEGNENWIGSFINEADEKIIKLNGVECENIIKLVKKFPALKVVGFFDYFKENKMRDTYIVFSESYYKDFTEYRMIGTCDGQSDFPFSEEVDILAKSEKTYQGTYSYNGKEFTITYAFPFEKEWNRCVEEKTVVPVSEETIISDSAFENNDRLISVEILDCIKKIGKKAFCNCGYLKKAFIPNGVKKIDNFTFSSCRNLQTILIPNTVSDIGNCAFKDCYSLEKVEFPINLKKIGSSAFCNCKTLMKVIFPEGITKIGKNAFKGCGKIKQIEIPGGVQSIEEGAFSDCWSLKKAIIAEGVEFIGGKAFKGCYNLESITLPFSIVRIDSCAFDGCAKLKSIVVPNPNAVIDESVKKMVKII